MADPECAGGGGVSHILAGKRGVIASLYSKKIMKMRYFHQEGGGRTPGTPYAGSATVLYVYDIFDPDSQMATLFKN